VTYVARSHTVFHHRNHIVWITKYRDSVLEGALRDRIRTIIRQVCKELGVQIISGVLAREHVHMFVVFSNLKWRQRIIKVRSSRVSVRVGVGRYARI
jgi:REP element-mobilizing transposase RayT